ncbi:hypothetical protein EW145_g595 [Phellinidium pouzarii]|uniref:IMD domain-containing protein n=1 Tax=Phellinidium pouzarii TaxID=167371 RepID=A0A4S4LJJ0_9AGAM|nr:hypothetical protein EW145_g595 [Phellinidium pouzarii]
MPRPRTSMRALTVNHNMGEVASGPPSPTLSEATQASQMNFGAEGPEKVITRADLKSSLQAYENLLNMSAGYRDALMHMSKATASFAEAMGTCSRYFVSRKPIWPLEIDEIEVSRVYPIFQDPVYRLRRDYTISWEIIGMFCDSIDKQFERPLRQHLDAYRAAVSDRSVTYEKALRERSRIIRQTEMENMNLGRKKNRNLQSFREALAVLQRQVEELDGLRVSHYQEILEHEEEVWDSVQGKVSLVVRSTLDVIDRFTAKASDPVIEPMLQSIPDPFDSYGPPKPEDQIFSILAPLSIFNSSSSPSPQAATTEIDPSPAFATSPGGHSWTSSHDELDNTSEWADVHTPISSPPPSTKSSGTITIKHAPSPPGSMRRASYPIPSGSSSLSPAKSPGALRKAESKLRKSLSVINESQAQSTSGFAEGSKSGTSTPFNGHTRDASSDTMRPLDTDVSGRTNGSHRNSFADHPIWGSHETTSSATLHEDEAGIGMNGADAGVRSRSEGFDPNPDTRENEG